MIFRSFVLLLRASATIDSKFVPEVIIASVAVLPRSGLDRNCCSLLAEICVVIEY
jgi:hypothetical protein